MANLEAIKRAISILYIAEEFGFTIKKVGAFYTIKEHDSVRISRERNIFVRNSSGDGGSVIDFVMVFANMSFVEAVDFLDSKLYEHYSFPDEVVWPEKKVVKNLILPPAGTTMRNVFAYLIKSRGIDTEVVQFLVDKKQLYQDCHKNCVFVSYEDGDPVFANIRGTNTDKRFLADVPGSNYNHCFYVRGSSAMVVVAESVIDLMSYMTMLKFNDVDYRQYDYLALSGTAKFDAAIKNHVNKNDYKYIRLCLDNDAAGRLCARNIISLLEELNFPGKVEIDFPAEGKDQNEYLMTIKRRMNNE